MEKIPVLLVDDHTVVRRGLRKILNSDAEIDVVGEAEDGRAAVESARRLRPAVVVMDVSLPGLNGIDATRQIVKGSDGVAVLILTMHADDVYVREGLKAGARGYLRKDSEEFDLIEGVKTVARGGSYFSPPISRVLAEGAGATSGDRAANALWRLSGREREVLQLIAEGKTKREIASILMLSPNTVETHRKHVMEKLALHNTAELVRAAVRSGIAA
jgi:two-component system response regulator NreC